MRTTSAFSTVLARLRTPHSAELVQVSFTGTPAAVTAVAHALAQVVIVTGMAHKPTADQAIRLDVTCFPAGAGRRS